ncbi:MAG: hypothetical protein R3B09_01225 [Nannocystaceae bacterium]
MSGSTPAKIERDGTFAVQMLQDSLVLALAVDAAITIVSGLGALQAILGFGAAALAIFVGTLLLQAIFNATRESLPRKLGGWAGVSLALAAALHDPLGALAWPLAGGAFVFTAIHTLVLHRKADLEFRSEVAEKAGNLALAARLADESRDLRSLPPAVEGATMGLPEGLDPELRAAFDRAVAAHLEVHDLLADPAFVAICGALPDAVVGAGEELLADLRRRAGLLTRVQRAAAEADADPSHQEAARAGVALFSERAALLQALARAAVQLAATEGPAELARFQDAVERLQGAL